MLVPLARGYDRGIVCTVCPSVILKSNNESHTQRYNDVSRAAGSTATGHPAETVVRILEKKPLL